MWVTHNAIKCFLNLFTLYLIIRQQQNVIEYFLISTTYELLVDPLAMTLFRTKANYMVCISSMMHHILVSIWSSHLTMRQWNHIFVMVSCRAIMYGSSVARRLPVYRISDIQRDFIVNVAGTLQLFMLLFLSYRDYFGRGQIYETRIITFFEMHFIHLLFFIKLLYMISQRFIGFILVYRVKGIEQPVLWPCIVRRVE